MDSAEFQTVPEDVFEKVANILGVKAGEYAVDGDRLHNFKKAAALQSITPAEALGGMLAKHVGSIFDYIAKADDSFTLEQWDEKLIDSINYHILLRAIVVEALNKQAQEATKHAN